MFWEYLIAAGYHDGSLMQIYGGGDINSLKCDKSCLAYSNLALKYYLRINCALTFVLLFVSKQYNLNQNMQRELSNLRIGDSFLNNPRPITTASLDSLLISNFRSFRGDTYVGPFLPFTAVIGPNGSGKSNILQAILFCLCAEDSQSLFDLRQLICRQSSQSYQQLTQEGRVCRVQLRLRTPADKIIFQRELDSLSHQRFKINHEECTRAHYQNWLKAAAFQPNCSNFAISQGQIDKLLLKSPNQLTYYFQQLSGSSQLKTQYDELKSQLQHCTTDLQHLYNRNLKLKTQKKQLKQLNLAAVQFTKAQQSYDEVLQKVLHAQALLSEQDVRECEEALRERRVQEQKKIQEVNEKKARIAKEMEHKQQLQENMAGWQKKVREYMVRLAQSQEASVVLAQQAAQNIRKQLQRSDAQLQHLLAERTILQTKASHQLDQQVVSQFSTAYGVWEAENSAMGKEMDKKKTELRYLAAIIEAKQLVIKENKAKNIRETQAVRDKKQIMSSTEKDISMLTQSIDKMKIDMAKQSEIFQRGKMQIKEKQNKLEEMYSKSASLEEILLEDIEEDKERQTMKRLLQVVGFKGPIHQHIKPTAAKYDVCFQLLLGPLRKHLVCTDENCSKQIASRLREYNQVKSLLILQNVRGGGDTTLRDALGKDAVMAFDIVDYDRNLPNFGLFLKEQLRGKVVCNNLEEAYEMKGRNLRYLTQIYTLDGNVLRADGVVSSCGNLEHLKKNAKYMNNQGSRAKLEVQLKRVMQDKTNIQHELNALKQKYDQSILVRRNLQISKLIQSRQEKSNLLTKLQTTTVDFKGQKLSKSLENQIQQLRRKQIKIQQSLNKLQETISSSSVFSKFLTRHNISLSAFREMSEDVEQRLKEKYYTAKELKKYDVEIVKAEGEIRQLSAKLQEQEQKAGLNSQSRQKLEEDLNQAQRQFALARDALARVGANKSNELHFQSQIPILESKLSILIKRHQAFIAEQAENLGLIPEFPFIVNYDILKDYLVVDKLNKKKIQQALETILKSKQQVEKSLEKFNTFQMFAAGQGQDDGRIQQGMIQTQEQIKKLNDRKTQITQQLSRLKNQRRNSFLSYLQKVKPILQEAYRVLTQEDGVSGSVNIYLQNEQTPFQHGIYFSPTPRNKRFIYDLEQLSGGEKSMASVALQYALAAASGCHFLLLDESDAFLDTANVQKLLKLIGVAKSMQFILITHKQSLFARTQSLVGVAYLKQAGSTFAYSLKINS